MRLLPSEQEERIEKAVKELEETGSLTICQPCDCGSQVRHNNGGNYHEIIQLRRDERHAGGVYYVKYETTCELVPPAEWEEERYPTSVIRNHRDWL